MDEGREELSSESASKLLESIDIDVTEVVGVDFVNEDCGNTGMVGNGEEDSSVTETIEDLMLTEAPRIEPVSEITEEALEESDSPCPKLEPQDGLQKEEEKNAEKPETGSMEAVKASILVRKQRAQMIRHVLSRKSKMLQIKLWQKSISSSEIVEEKEDEPRPKRPRSETPSPVPIMSRFSPDITQYRRRKPLLIAPPPVRKESSTSGSGSTKSSEKEEEHDGEKEDQESEGEEVPDHEAGDDAASSDNEENVSVQDSSRSTESRTDAAALLLATRGEAFVKLDSRIVEDLIRDGKPIRAAAVAALEAVHGKKLTELEALVKLRKAYINKPLPRGRGRRSIMKKFLKPNRSPKPGYWCRVVNSVTFRNSYFQVGDIVYVKSEDGQIYFLQIHAILMDSRENEGYGKMIWITPKPDFKGKRFPFHPRNYDLRRDICPLIASLSTVTHVAHCPLDYFDGHPSFWKPESGTVYQKFGEPLVKWRPFHNPKVDTPPESSQGPVTEANTGDSVIGGTEDVIAAEIDITQMEEDAVAGN